MRVVVQRVKRASVSVDSQLVGKINAGMLVFLGVAREDEPKDIDYLVNKVIHLRMFEDDQGKMNRSCVECAKEILVVSQFTVYGDCRKGRRPSFDQAADPQKGKDYYERFISKIQAQGLKVESGTFQAMMDVELVNDGPVTFIIDSI